MLNKKSPVLGEGEVGPSICGGSKETRGEMEGQVSITGEGYPKEEEDAHRYVIWDEGIKDSWERGGCKLPPELSLPASATTALAVLSHCVTVSCPPHMPIWLQPASPLVCSPTTPHLLCGMKPLPLPPHHSWFVELRPLSLSWVRPPVQR